MRVLVAGGAGYIGSVVVEQLVADGAEVVVYDNLSQGHQVAVHPQATLVEGDLADRELLAGVFQEWQFGGVMHFAGNTLVGESMARPFLYLGDNVRNGLNLLEMAVTYGVRRFVLSSTANLFAAGDRSVDEGAAVEPCSPYGESKYMLERMLYWLARTQGVQYAVLRYFNAAGASGNYGEDHCPETHLIPLALQTALGRREQVEIFGGDYATPDGTCVRDYVHVVDLAQAHLLALDELEFDAGSGVYHLGSGRGYSVLEVLEVARIVTGHPIPAVMAARRPGDPARLVANPRKAEQVLGWRQRHGNLHTIIQSAWRWQQQHPSGYA